MTSSFDLATWFLFVTNCFALIIICAKLLLNLLVPGKIMRRMNVTEAHTHSWSVTLTFDLTTWFLLATPYLFIKMFVTNDFQILSCKMKLWVTTILEHTNRTNEHTHTHTHTWTRYILYEFSAILWRGHKTETLILLDSPCSKCYIWHLVTIGFVVSERLSF